MNPTLGSYLLYSVLSLALVAWVARTLKQNGALFLRHVFTAEGLADSVNQLLLVGFYLVNIGFVSRQLKSASEAQSINGAVEMLAEKIGIVALVLGGMHFFNLFVFSRIWRIRPPSTATATTTPTSASTWIGVAQSAARRASPTMALPEIPGAPTSAGIPATSTLTTARTTASYGAWPRASWRSACQHDVGGARSRDVLCPAVGHGRAAVTAASRRL